MKVTIKQKDKEITELKKVVHFYFYVFIDYIPEPPTVAQVL